MLQFPNHTKILDYRLEFNLCGERGCDLYPRMPLVLQMHDEELKKEVLSSCPLSRLDVDGNIFLPINKCQRVMENGSSLVDELKDRNKLRVEFKDNANELSEREKVMVS